ncbi:MAG: hypothetical protein WAL85_21130 [Candidatus Korobacteraceae bacterium]
MTKKKTVEAEAILTPVYHLQSIAHSLDRLENAFSLFIIAQYGTEEDRAIIVKHLRSEREAFQAK